MRFEFSTPTRIVFGAGTLLDAGRIARDLGGRPLVVTGRDLGRAQRLLGLLDAEGLDATTFAVTREPDVEVIEDGAAQARDEGCDCVIGFGGGAALDAAKAIATLATNEGDLLDYLEIIGRGRPLAEAPVPVLAIPTTAGTGSEVTRNSVIISPEHRIKVSLRSPLMMPRVALVDPELTYCLPPTVTATTGVDALTQLIEPYVSRRANPMTDGLCREGIARAAHSLRRAVADACEADVAAGGVTDPGGGPDAPRGPGDSDASGRVPRDAGRVDAEAREDMAVASLFGGLALANAGLGAVHGIAGPLGGMVVAPHGAICAALLPVVVEADLRALRERAPDSKALPRYREIARLLTGDPGAAADEAGVWLRGLVDDLGIPGLATHGLTAENVDELVDKAAAANSMKGNPIELTHDELATIILAAL